MFTHLHWHSHYSLLEGLWKPIAIIEKAKQLWMSAITISDYWAMFWAVEFYKLWKKAWIKTIIWVDICIVPQMTKKESNEKPQYLTILAKDYQWYLNLMEIVSLANLEWLNIKPRIDINTLQKYSKWLIWFMWWENSQIWDMILSNESTQKMIDLISMYQDLFWKENFLLEIIVQDYMKILKLKTINETILNLAEKTDTTLIINNNFHYLNKDDKEAFEVAYCVKEWMIIYDQTRKKVHWNFHIMSEEEIVEILKKNKFDEQLIQKLIENNQKIVDSITLEIPLWNILFPKYESPEDIKKLYEENKDQIVSD